jgi:hypothetical protein
MTAGASLEAGWSRSPALLLQQQGGAKRAPARKSAGMTRRKGTQMMTTNRASAANRRYLPSSPFKPPPEAPPVERYAPHDLVTHDKYGLGRVVLVEGDTAVVVDFAPRMVRIMAPFAKMTKL